MGSHPINLAVRFLLEIGALLGMAYWGWTQHDGAVRFVWAVGLPLVSAVIWGTFAVPEESEPVRQGAGSCARDCAFAVGIGLFCAGDLGYGRFWAASGGLCIWGGCGCTLRVFL